MAQLARGLAELIYPARCVACGAACGSGGNIDSLADGAPDRAGKQICDDCQSELDPIILRPRCRRCAAPLAEHDSPCALCRGRGLRPFDRIITLGHYAEPVREWIHRVKYRGNWPLAEALAAKLWQSDSVRELLSQSDCLVPVPLHWSRQIERGFDQSRVLAESLSRQSGLPVIPAVMRRRRTAAQALLPARWRRRDNVRDAFALVDRRRSMTTGQRMVLVDDMVTTGSTVRAVAWAIRGLRPAKLSVLAVARSDPLGRQFEQI